MNSFFSGDYETLWGFSFNKYGDYNYDLKELPMSNAKKYLLNSIEDNYDIHILPNDKIPLIKIKTGYNTFYFCQTVDDWKKLIQNAADEENHLNDLFD